MMEPLIGLGVFVAVLFSFAAWRQRRHRGGTTFTMDERKEDRRGEIGSGGYGTG
jgi:hypothetical protein